MIYITYTKGPKCFDFRGARWPKSLVNDEERDFCMKAYLLHNGIKKDLLYKVQVFGYHDHHINIPALHKALDGRFDFLIGYGVKTMGFGKGVLQKVQQMFFVLFLFFIKAVPFF